MSMPQFTKLVLVLQEPPYTKVTIEKFQNQPKYKVTTEYKGEEKPFYVLTEKETLKQVVTMVEKENFKVTKLENEEYIDYTKMLFSD